ncbi:hypothetical protein T484DRAFT_1930953 [Baffinella frigidus]|nr:hypothetical protein T484DRAFT_1930953 [Cryptophyta sp. CCMP2293]|mmetsp:Transcript_35015/g.83008  ORF Transcript_35015/g.83008 Transcript_35015/m.83008 type:complete len:224 (+) Transcript_35015:62-733(+)
MYSSTTTHQSNVAGRQHGRVLYLYLPTCIALGCLALACTYSDETTEPDGIMPEYETSKGDPAVSNHASRLEIYREGTSMAGVPLNTGRDIFAKRERISKLELQDRESHSWLPRTIWKLKHLVDRLTTEGRERSGAPPATGGTATGGQSSGVATAETKRLARLKNILSHDIQSIERQSPQLAYQGMPGLVLPLRSLRPAARGVVPLLHPVVALPPAAAAPGTRR